MEGVKSTAEGQVQELQQQLQSLRVANESLTNQVQALLAAQPVAPVNPVPQQPVVQQNLGGTQSVTLKPPKPKPYKGQPNLEGWLFTMRKYLTVLGVTSDALAVEYASACLEGPAVDWWRMLEEDARNNRARLPTNWAEFETAIKARFIRSTEEEFSRAKINTMKQTGSVRGFNESFTKTALKCRTMDERTMLDLYVNALKPDTRDFVFKEDPQDLKEAQRLAERFDNRRYQQRQFQRDDRSYNRSRNNNNQSDPMEVDHSRMNSASGTGRGRGRGHGQNGNTRSVRKCYACGEPGHIARDCKKQGKSHKKQPKVNAAQGTESASSSDSEN